MMHEQNINTSPQNLQVVPGSRGSGSVLIPAR